jgi:formylglycine-generating enzyme required for sulfatase activity/pimeloyl-ACP methyl ester carboxylesterase
MIGETVSHYRILAKLGGGGMGVVYRAEDTHLGRDVALKFLPPELTRDREARERFTLEARAASALDHANICTIHDIDETDDGRLFIAMAFYAGETLKARAARGPIGIGEAIDIAREIAAGLKRAHEGGIVHRDIKPANLMITERGEVKILDFGVAKLVGEVGLTRTGSTLGTLAYMSPEQVEGKGVGPITDLWALGVVLYEMLTGSLPFAGKSESETVAAILAREPEGPGVRCPEIPPEVETLVLDLLAKDPADRPASAGAVEERLGAIARSTAAGLAIQLFRRPATWIATAAAMAVVAGAIIVPALRHSRVDAARANLPQIESLVREGRYAEAYELAVQAEGALGGDTTLQRLIPEVSDVLTVRSEPEGAEVYAWGPGAIEAAVLLGTTPIVEVRLPRGDHFLTVEADGYEPVERLASSTLARAEAAVFGDEFDIVLDVTLFLADSRPPGTVFVPAGAYTLASADAPVGATVDLGPFFIDRFEVTNAEYREFVRARGYSNQELWTLPIRREGRALAEDETSTLFRDRTGLPGPRDWTGQEFPEGTDRHPVSSITHYEAAAYCAWKGRSLPTLFEWEKVARGGAFTPLEGIVFPWGLVESGQSTEERANFGGSGTVEVDTHPLGLSPYGAYAMAGNVREWTANATGDGFIAMGGSWQDPPYVFSSMATPEGLFASPALGFRCVLRTGSAEAHGAGRIELARRSPSYQPVDEATYRSFLAHYRYDPVELEPETLETLETEDWTRLTVRFNGVGEESILAYLYLPSGATPPYQTMVFLPGAGAFFGHPIDVQAEWLLGANIRAGRAVFSVVMDGMVGREWQPGRGFPDSNTVGFRDLMVRHSTELSLGLDYLETRDDIDMDRLAYVGMSWGAGSRAVLAAIDDRWDAVIFVGAGIDERVQPTVPEALNVNFIPYIRVPKLLLNGRQDEEHPWLTRALPFWELLGEPKELVLADNEGHAPSLEVRVPAINDFLDRRFGPVR